MKKTKFILPIFILLSILALSSTVKADTNTLSPNQYWGLGKNMSFGDTLTVQVSSDNSINAYLMTTNQMLLYQANPEDTAESYYSGKVSYTLCGFVFTAPDDALYYILIINPSDTNSAIVVVDASIEYYEEPETPDPITEYVYLTDYLTIYDYSGWFASIILLIFAITITVLFIKNKKKLRELEY